MDMNNLFNLEQRIIQLESTLPGLRIAQRRRARVASFESDVRNREFQILNLKVKLQMLHKQIGIGSEHGGSTAAYPAAHGLHCYVAGRTQCSRPLAEC
jgi:hypothetical protein